MPLLILVRLVLFPLADNVVRLAFVIFALLVNPLRKSCLDRQYYTKIVRQMLFVRYCLRTLCQQLVDQLLCSTGTSAAFLEGELFCLCVQFLHGDVQTVLFCQSVDDLQI